MHRRNTRQKSVSTQTRLWFYMRCLTHNIHVSKVEKVWKKIFPDREQTLAELFRWRSAYEKKYKIELKPLNGEIDLNDVKFLNAIKSEKK